MTSRKIYISLTFSPNYGEEDIREGRCCFFKVYFVWKYIKIIFFYFLKFIFDISKSKRSKNKKNNLKQKNII
jgi:hypothetical protein